MYENKVSRIFSPLFSRFFFQKSSNWRESWNVNKVSRFCRIFPDFFSGFFSFFCSEIDDLIFEFFSLRIRKNFHTAAWIPVDPSRHLAAVIRRKGKSRFWEKKYFCFIIIIIINTIINYLFAVSPYLPWPKRRFCSPVLKILRILRIFIGPKNLSTISRFFFLKFFLRKYLTQIHHRIHRRYILGYSRPFFSPIKYLWIFCPFFSFFCYSYPPEKKITFNTSDANEKQHHFCQQQTNNFW